MSSRKLQTIWWLALGLISLILAYRQAGDFAPYTSNHHVMVEMNDIQFIARGFAGIHNPVQCLIGGFTGTLNQEGIQVYRPLANILSYFELRLGQNFGWMAVGYFGILIHVINSWLSIALVWRATRSQVASLAAAVCAPYAPLIGNYSPEWAVWFPCHPELLMMTWLFAMLLFLDKWLEDGKKSSLAGAAAFFVLGLFTKEFFIIVPFMALAFMATHPNFKQRIRPALAFCGVSMLACVGFMLVRRVLLTNPRNPMPLKWVHFYMGKKIFYWLAHPFYLYIPDPVFNLWYPGLAIFLLIVGSFTIRAYKRYPKLRTERYGLPLLVFLPIVAVMLYLQFLTPEGGWANALQWIVQSLGHPIHLWMLMGTTYSFYLLFKYRKGSRAFSAFWLLVLVYVPAFTMDGWHYGMAGAILRGGFFWPVVIQLAYRDFRPYLGPRLGQLE